VVNSLGLYGGFYLYDTASVYEWINDISQVFKDNGANSISSPAKYTCFVMHILLKVYNTDEILAKIAWNCILSFE
jgi:hypothetical protein